MALHNKRNQNAPSWADILPGHKKEMVMAQLSMCERYVISSLVKLKLHYFSFFKL